MRVKLSIDLQHCLVQVLSFFPTTRIYNPLFIKNIYKVYKFYAIWSTLPSTCGVSSYSLPLGYPPRLALGYITQALLLPTILDVKSTR